MEVYANDIEQCIAKFSLDLVSPVEYLFRKYSLDDNSMSEFYIAIAIAIAICSTW